jgi:hypothetical protein
MTIYSYIQSFMTISWSIQKSLRGKHKHTVTTQLFLFRKFDNPTLDRLLTRGSILLVTAHARDMGRESPFAVRQGRYVTNVWYKRHYLVPLRGISTAVLPPSYIQNFMTISWGIQKSLRGKHKHKHTDTDTITLSHRPTFTFWNKDVGWKKKEYW